MGDAITATFGLDISPLKQGFQEAKAVAQSGSAEIERAITASSQRSSQQLAAAAVAGWRTSQGLGGGATFGLASSAIPSTRNFRYGGRLRTCPRREIYND